MIHYPFFLICCILLMPWQAYAYLDPGTGSLIIQVIVASLIGGSFFIKTYWRKIIDFFKKALFPKKTEADKD